MVKNQPANAEETGDAGLISESGRSPGEGNSNPLQHSCLENPTDRGTWWATVHRVCKRVGDDSTSTTATTKGHRDCMVFLLLL